MPLSAAATLYTRGQRVELSATFSNRAGALENPASVTLLVKAPSGTVTTYTGAQVANPTVGVFTRDVDLDTAGLWWVRFESTGLVAAAEQALAVQASAF